jgi:uncharacterized protein (TIGR02284 family)
MTNKILIAGFLALQMAGLAACATEPKIVAAPQAELAGKRDDVESLSRLTSMSIDAAELYRDASAMAKDAGLKSQLTQLAASRDQLASVLQLKMGELGVKPEEAGKPVGARERVFAKISAALQDKNKAAARAAAESEQDLARAMQQAVDNPYVNPDVKQTLQDQLPGVEQDRDRVQSLARRFGAAV